MFLAKSTHIRPTRFDHLLTSTSHRFDSELKRLAVKMGGKGGNGGEESGNTSALRRLVQVRSPPSCHLSHSESTHA